jgi:hypothetical protein
MSRQANEQEALPCPFCGELPDVNAQTNAGFYVDCPNPDCTVTVQTSSWNTEEDALAKWNKRFVYDPYPGE